MSRLALAVAASLSAALAPAAPVFAQGVFIDPPPIGTRPSAEGLRGVRAHVQNQLPVWGYPDVDVRDLTLSQVVLINSTIHSGRSLADIQGLVGSIIRRGGVLQRGVVDPLTGRR
ncbi:MAG: hypothetical protein AAF390_11515 [Pseudomonadota bacterium]